MLSLASPHLCLVIVKNLVSLQRWLKVGVFLILAQFALNALAQPAATVAPWPKNRTTPTLTLMDTTGQARNLSEQRGKVMLLNFWATWCEPCRAEMPALQQLATHSADRLQVWAINYKESTSKVLQFQQQIQWDHPILLDTDGQVAGQWTRRIFHTTVVIDARGRARWIVTGEFDWTSKQAQQILGPLLKQTAAPRL